MSSEKVNFALNSFVSNQAVDVQGRCKAQCAGSGNPAPWQSNNKTIKHHELYHYNHQHNHHHRHHHDHHPHFHWLLLRWWQGQALWGSWVLLSWAGISTAAWGALPLVSTMMNMGALACQTLSVLTCGLHHTPFPLFTLFPPSRPPAGIPCVPCGAPGSTQPGPRGVPL